MENNYLIAMILFVIAALFFMRNIRHSKQAKKHVQEGNAFLLENSQRDTIIVTSSGLQYEVLAEGSGSESPTLNSQVKVHYHGTLLNGHVFDSSVDRKQPISFKLKQVIRGWQEGVQTMIAGQKIKLYVPSQLAYGNRQMGSIPPGSLLIFEIELLDIN